MAAKEMYGNLGQSRDFSLLAGTGTERTVGVAVKPGSGLLARGPIIQMGADGLYRRLTPGENAPLNSQEYFFRQAYEAVSRGTQTE